MICLFHLTIICLLLKMTQKKLENILFTNHHDDSELIYENKLVFLLILAQKKNNIEVKSLDRIER